MKVLQPIGITLTAICMLLSTAANAQYRNRNENNSMDQGHSISSSQMMAAYNAPARYDVEESWDSYLFGKFLYMIAYQDNMSYVINKTDVTRTIPPQGGKIINTDFQWHPGVKIGIGMNTDFDDWSVNAEWMHLISKNRGSQQRVAGGNLFPTQDFNNASETATDARTTWSMVFNYLDLLLGRTGYNGRNVTLDVVYGPSGVWIQQEFNNQYEGVDDADGGQNTTRTFSKFSSWGVGPKAGIRSSWLLGMGFEFIGNAHASLLFTRFNSKLESINPDLAPLFSGRSGDVVLSTRMNKVNTLRPNTSFELGFGWGSYFDQDNWHVKIALSYEYQLYWDQNAGLSFIDDIQKGKFVVTGGNLTMHGGAFSLRFDF